MEEYWDPIIPELDQIIVKRKLPMIHIVLSIDPLDENELGYAIQLKVKNLYLKYNFLVIKHLMFKLV